MFFLESFNIWSLISMLLLPLSLLGLGLLVNSKKETSVNSLIIGSSIVVTILSVWALVIPFGFREISWLVFLIGIYGFITNYSIFKKSIIQLVRSLSLKQSNGSLVVIVSKGLVIAFVIKLVLFIFLRPVIDPDVVQYYLPFARSLLKYGHFPLSDFYTGLPLNNVSIGSLVLYGYSFAIGTVHNFASFILIPFTLIIGIGVYWFKFVKNLSRSEKVAWLTLAILVSLPFVDSALFETLFYPDYLFVLLFLYFIDFIFKLSKNYIQSTRFFVMAGSVTISLLLVKFHAVLVLLLLTGFLTSHFLHGNVKRILIVLFTLLVFGFKLFDHHFFKSPNFIDFVVSPFILAYILLKIPQSSIKLNRKHIAKTFAWLLVVASVGGVWWWRNLILSTSFFGKISPDNYWASSLVSKVTQEISYYQRSSFLQQILHKIKYVNIPDYIQPKFTSLAILFWSAMGSFWIIPKIVALFTKKNNLEMKLAYWLVGWYLIWIFYLGGVSSRHLLHVFPLLAYFMSKGLLWLSSKVFKSYSLRDRFLVAYLLLLSFVSLAQSRFLSWNLGTILFGQEKLHQVARETIGSDSLNQVGNLTAASTSVTSQFRKLLTAMNLSGYPASQYFLLIAMSSIVISSISFIISYLFIKKKKLKFSRKSRLKIGMITITVFSLPYLATMSILSYGNLFNFATMETEKVYTYGGQFNELIPYLKEHLEPTDKIILLAPATGLPYYLNHPVIDVLNTFELKQLRPIVKSNDLAEIESFIETNNFRYLAIREDKGILSEVQILQKKFIFFEKIFQLDNIKKIIEPNSVSTWSLYRLY